MIYIAEQPSKKCVGKTSLYLKFDYNPAFINIVKQAGNAVWNKKELTWEVPISKLSFLIDNLALLDDITIDVLEEDTRQSLDLTIDYKSKPFEYQKEGIKWLLNNQNGLLMDVPGLGKTLQCIYACDELKVQKNIQHALIICGVNSLKSNWEKEIQKHSTNNAIVIGKHVNRNNTISYSSVKERAQQLYDPIDEFYVIINVEMLTSQIVVDAILNSKNKFDVIIVDEIHKCKGTKSQRSKNLLKIAKAGTYHYGLTGTLLINSPLDAYMPLKFIGEEKACFSSFKEYYCVYTTSKYSAYQIAGFKNMADLEDEIYSCSLRRTKDLLELPEKTVIPEYISMSDIQSKFYNDIAAGAVEEADRINIKVNSLLGLVTRLRQACTCPEMLSTSVTDSCKIERAAELAEEIVSSGEKVVIFSTFKAPINSLYTLLKELNPVCVTGDTSNEEASESIDKFMNDPNCPIFLGTIAKCGTGITLTSASYMIFVDAPWTYADFAQCCDRIHRIGTKNNVTIYNLIVEGTIDERINHILEQKKGISDVIIDNDYNQSDELKELLGIE